MLLKLKLMKSLFTFTLLLLLLLPLVGQNELQVLNPQRDWDRKTGLITEYSITLKPAGIYTEVGLYLTFSAQPGDFSNNTDLEVDFTFHLPEKAIVTDSWLWIEDIIIRAKMLDRWTANQIYESIVDRRQDPSILVKDGPGKYNLRIYPMRGDGQRKVKLNYLVPAQWHPDKVITSIPLGDLDDSVNDIENIQVRSWLGSEWGTPKVEGMPELTFAPMSNENLGNFWEANLNQQAAKLNALKVSTDAPLEDGVFLGSLEAAGEQLYQMVLFPDQIVEVVAEGAKRVMVLLDHEPENSNINQTQLLEQLKNHLKASLKPTDFFNIMVADLVVEPERPAWIPASSANIDQVFSDLGPNPIMDLNVLAGLLGEGIAFIQQGEQEGELILVSNNDRLTDLDKANNLINSVMTLRGESNIPIHILNYQDQTIPSTWINNRQFKGNDYLFRILSQQTKGDYFNQLECCVALEDNLTTLFTVVGAIRGQLDVHTSLDSGFCYNRYTVSGEGQSVNLGAPFTQIGKYSGTFPFRIELAGELDQLLFSERVTVPASATVASDTLLQEAWAGQFLRTLEGESQSTAAINDIIHRSIEDRVLSLYTALIALEPNLGGEPCNNCIDESEDGEVVIGLKDRINELIKMEAYPNPFREKVNIEVRFPEKVDPESCRFAIYNSLGQMVRLFEERSYTGSNEFRFSWTPGTGPDPEVPAGIYLFVAETAYGVNRLQLHYVD